MGIFIFLGLLAGTFVPVQTGVNAKLGHDTQEPFCHLVFYFWLEPCFY